MPKNYKKQNGPIPENKTLLAEIHCDSRDGIIKLMDKDGSIDYLKEKCRKAWIEANKPYLLTITDVLCKELFRRVVQNN